MRFEEAVRSTPALTGAFRKGLQALRGKDHDLIVCKEPRRLAGSVDIDTALKDALPKSPRWDYAIGVKRNRDSDKVTWVEVHPASATHEVDCVLAKLIWLKGWITKEASDFMCLPREYVWVATGRVTFTPHSPQRKRLANAGITFAGGQYTIQAG